MIHRVFAIRANRCPAAVPLVGVLLLMLHASASCALPDVSAIGAPEGSNYMKTILFIVGLGIGVAALILAGASFLEIAGGILGKFNEWRIGRAEVGDLKKVVVAGAVVLALVILLVTVAVSVIDSSSTITG
jgi:integrating conjugative element membrane protein (TIGR03745 family)